MISPLKLLPGFIPIVGLSLVIANTESPRRLDVQQAVKAVGGCGSGLCGGYQSGPCLYPGDDCGIFATCSSNNDGPFICTPQSFCGDAGCGGLFLGGTCH